jgi:D(-)-tartrate dehydratase
VAWLAGWLAGEKLPLRFHFPHIQTPPPSAWGRSHESYPELFQPYGGFPDGVSVDNGHVTLPDLPGIGFEGKADLYREMKALSQV